MEIRNGMRPVHPGEILSEDMHASGVTQDDLAQALDMRVDMVTSILEGREAVTADTALRLARYLGTTPELWLNLQQTWELRVAEMAVGRKIAERVTPRQSAA
ncbi:MAG: HigA family addiction module antidote protein [Gammaproteobacteria bacterium]|nr:HigA family addiction module antitoxin [Gammaproteobacteria bacterium]MYF30062.1 HigA family addiction module antidote protein [Gammaproteobacteria bacterium]MYK08424.1 HigA family addiction module antidote protein [Terriglobia bacterium]